MRAIAPQLDTDQVTIAEDQVEENFYPITAAMIYNRGYALPPGSKYNTLVLAFRPNDAERKRIAEGDDIYVALLTFGHPMPGIIVNAGKEEASLTFNVPVRE